MNLLEKLKQQTEKQHQQAHRLDYFKALFKEELPIEAFFGQIRCLSIIISAMESQLEKQFPDFIDFIALGYKKKLPFLLNDLKFLQPRISGEIKSASSEALNLADEIILDSQRNPISLLGYLYTLEGSLQGGKVILPIVKKQFHLDDNHGVSYFTSQSMEDDHYWKRFKTKLIQLTPDDAMDDVINSSIKTFSGLIKIYDTLYPFNSSTLSFDASSLNPEAGNLPIPDDPLLISAAIDASRKCWYHYPYFELRYGERGYRFGLSDTSWLCTLIDLDNDIIEQQVLWLSRVLSNNGIPSIMLEKQLWFLYDELIVLPVKKKKRFKKIAYAAEFLNEQRNKVLSDKKSKTYAGAFDRQADINWSRKLRNPGSLIVCSIIDYKMGASQSIIKMKNWLSDDKYFPGDWCNKVLQTYEKLEKKIL